MMWGVYVVALGVALAVGVWLTRPAGGHWKTRPRPPEPPPPPPADPAP